MTLRELLKDLKIDPDKVYGIWLERTIYPCWSVGIERG